MAKNFPTNEAVNAALESLVGIARAVAKLPSQQTTFHQTHFAVCNSA
jgi:hypothetical protein